MIANTMYRIMVITRLAYVPVLKTKTNTTVCHITRQKEGRIAAKLKAEPIMSGSLKSEDAVCLRRLEIVMCEKVKLIL